MVLLNTDSFPWERVISVLTLHEVYGRHISHCFQAQNSWQARGDLLGGEDREVVFSSSLCCCIPALFHISIPF